MHDIIVEKSLTIFGCVCQHGNGRQKMSPHSPLCNIVLKRRFATSWELESSAINRLCTIARVFAANSFCESSSWPESGVVQYFKCTLTLAQYRRKHCEGTICQPSVLLIPCHLVKCGQCMLVDNVFTWEIYNALYNCVYRRVGTVVHLWIESVQATSPQRPCASSRSSLKLHEATKGGVPSLTVPKLRHFKQKLRDWINYGLLTMIFGWLFQNRHYAFLDLDGLASTSKDLNKVVNDVWSITQGG